LMRAESEVVGLIRESPVVTSHETFAQSVIQNDSENLYQSANLNEPVQNVAETASLPLHLPGSLNQSLDSEIATIARAPDGEHPPAGLVPTDEGRDSASTALVVTAKELPIPVVAIPLLERLQSELPDTRQAVDAFLTHLTELGNAALDSGSSLPFAAWLAAAAVSAIETMRRLHAARSRGRALLPSNGWIPPGPFADQL